MNLLNIQNCSRVRPISLLIQQRRNFDADSIKMDLEIAELIVVLT